jgi:hypothetical protein
MVEKNVASYAAGGSTFDLSYTTNNTTDSSMFPDISAFLIQ